MRTGSPGEGEPRAEGSFARTPQFPHGLYADLKRKQAGATLHSDDAAVDAAWGPDRVGPDAAAPAAGAARPSHAAPAASDAVRSLRPQLPPRGNITPAVASAPAVAPPGARAASIDATAARPVGVPPQPPGPEQALSQCVAAVPAAALLRACECSAILTVLRRATGAWRPRSPRRASSRG